MKMREFAEESKAWPFEEARKLRARIEKSGAQEAIFETGYGASGLPHMGTFGEVVRTSMVRHAFSILAPPSRKFVRQRASRAPRKRRGKAISKTARRPNEAAKTSPRKTGSCWLMKSIIMF